MPKKTKSRRAKPKAASKTRQAMQKRAEDARRTLRDISVEDRKELITDALEAFVANAPAEQREEIAEHISDIGIELVSHHYGVDSSNAMLVFQDDSTAQLIMAIDHHCATTGAEPNAIIAKLIGQLDTEATLVN